MANDTQLAIRALSQMSEISPEKWDACANPGSPIAYDPFTSHRFLQALEESGSATARTGWQPHHLVLEEMSTNDVLGCMPLYLKGHSQGEYIFDYGWADAFERAGGRYYPKLLSAIPFTPATGRRLLTRPGPDQTAYEETLIAGAIEVTKRLDVSSLHFNFVTRGQWDMAGQVGLLQRCDQQFHWENRGYDTFDDFLADLASRKRKQVKKERREALANDITIEWVTGDDLTEDHWDAFYTFYMDTGSRKWGSPYLTRDFFSIIGETLPEDTLLILCRRDGSYIAGALNFIGSETLFGRNWGCVEDHRFLHFETCYYQAIEFAIDRGLQRVEAGAQGAHKLARGYVPTQTYSAHWIANAGFRDAVGNYLKSERAHVESDVAYLSERTPFRKTVP